MRGLPGAYKLLWDFLYHDCDHAGIWIVDLDIAQMYLGRDMPIDSIQAIKLFNSGEVRIVELDEGKKWFIPSFIEFQYVKLSDKNNAHQSVITALNKYNLLDSDFKIIRLMSPSSGAMDKDKEEAMDKGKDKGQKKSFNTMPISSDFNGLPEEYILKSIQIVKLTSGIDITKGVALEFWDIFKLQELTGSAHYHNEGKVYSHFLNVIKKQKFTNGTADKKSVNGNRFSVGAEKLLEKGDNRYADIRGKQSD